MDHIVNYLKKKNKPLTRERYLNVAFLGNPPAELSAEQEAGLPKEIQKKSGKNSVEESEEPESQETNWLELFHKSIANT